MNELILKYNQLDELGKTALIEFLNSLLQRVNSTQNDKKNKPKLDYSQFHIPISQLKFDREAINERH